MEPQRPAEPTRLGPYRIIGTLDAGGQADDARRRIARDDRTGRTAVLMLPHETLADDPGYLVRFRSEGENSRRLTGGWAAPVIDVAGPDADLPWVAYACFPALPLPAALAAHDGPLPEPTVRALGAYLAHTLAGWHAGGLVHAGISPQATLLMVDGPRLTGYGLARAAALNGMGSDTSLGVDAFTVPPEQRAGERPSPAGDVYALGAVLCYAATGRLDVAEGTRAALPEGLRELLAVCLAQDPGQRPRPGMVARELRAASAPDAVGRLPDAVATALARQAAAYPAQAPMAAHASTEETAATPPPGRSRRAVVVGGLSGAVGLVLGAGGVAGWRAVGEGTGSRGTSARRGIAPAPLWRRDLGSEPQQTPLLWRGRTALVWTTDSVTALSLRTGRKIWSRDKLYPMSALTLLGNGTFVSPDTSAFSVVSLATGRIKGVERRYDGVEGPAIYQFLGADKDVCWFLTRKYASGGTGTEDHEVVCYDSVRRKEIWRAPLPAPYQGDGNTTALLLSTMLLLPSQGDDDENTSSYLALDRRSGRKLWTRKFAEMKDESAKQRVMAPGDLLVSCDEHMLRGYHLASGKERWRVATKGRVSATPAVHGPVVYATDSRATTFAVDVRSGSARWRRRSAAPLESSWTRGETAVSHSGATVFQVTDAEIEALDAADGSLRWRSALAGKGQQAAVPGQVVGVAPGIVLVLNGTILYALPVD
ncbi:PQQ-binding-like beta-propeller repeat protein [Streptomyces iranensis]|uniref:Outer membrane protein assembly factor BamB n=1 Tax=Streptomyces iranensis TaxID=576784 RepID=A0A060ZJ53_9ACTN|nr:PQQ-binding-like beta-propeller repeat protein [Streptomyces iranensis]MBP2068769.1 outer membrane protein assembly factor BamB [Streptomyces iranensis]CDR06075.1 serine/threonine protein kinase [Streptomyces iranensis]